MAATTYRKRMPSEKHYDKMLWAAVERYDAHPAYSEDMAVKQAMEIVRQRREADKKAIGLPKHWPAFETPLEHSDREIGLRFQGMSADDAAREMFVQDARAWIAAEPTWDAHTVTIHIMDRGYYVRYGYSWGLRIAQGVMAQ